MDFEKEGLLDGLSGSEREARIALLTGLIETGAEPDELKQAVEEGRLPLLPVARVLQHEEKYTAKQAAESVGLDPSFLLAMRRASGLPVEDPDAVLFDDSDVEAARALATFVEAGIPEQGLLDIARIFGELTARTAAATRNLIAESLLGDDDLDEYSLSLRLAQAARDLRPLTIFLLEYLYQLHMREQVRNEVAISAQAEDGAVPGLQEVNVCFVDLVGFTRLGEDIRPEELGGLAGRLATLIGDLVRPPVTLIKMIGDAGMLVSDDADALLDVALDLIEAAEREGDDFPGLKAGVARGEAIHRFGDWYGNPVNLASRVTSIARPGSVLATDDVREAVVGGYKWSFAGERRVKGVRREVALFRVRQIDA